jgi:nucleoporin NUP1
MFPFLDETAQLPPPTSTTHAWQLTKAATTSMQQSHRSPRQPVRTRSKPYARRQPPSRSVSIMATIKEIVTAPLSWFSTTDEFEDTPGKRRRAPVPQSNTDASDGHRSVKRQRVASTPPRPQGYLDPPLTMFQPRSKRDGASQDPASTTFPSSTSMNANTQERQPDKSGRHNLPATVWSRRDRSREVSTDDLPNRSTPRDATMVPLPVSREASLLSVPRDSSVGPVRTPFRMRTTLSPIPAGSEYGPNPRRRERDPSEPPPLTTLMSNPIFVKPPTTQHPAHRSQSAQPTTTLGALAQTSRAVGSLFLLYSSLVLTLLVVAQPRLAQTVEPTFKSSP